jgi:putative membrane protein
MKTYLNIKMIFFQVVLLVSFILTTAACKNKVSKNAVVIDKDNVKFINSPTDYDTQFLITAAEMNLEEVILSTLAQEKGTITLVKELGKMIKEDHQKALEELNELAKTKTITVPTAINDKGNEDYKNLNKNSGKDFDKAYSNMMVTMHKNAIVLFESASTDVTDPHIKKWALDALPVLHHHLEQAISCQQATEKI